MSDGAEALPVRLRPEPRWLRRDGCPLLLCEAIIMLLSPIGLAALKAREGVRLKAYKDSVGVWTIGYGSTKGVKPGQTITQAQADALFDADVDTHARPVLAAVKVKLADHERDALVSIAFNIGVGGFKKSTFLKRLNAGDRAGCAKAIMSWTKPPEIASRREAERDQFLTPYDVKLPKARSNDARPVRVSAKGVELGSTPPPTPLGGAPNVTFDKPWIRGVAYPELRDVQSLLKAKGYYLTGNVDGFWGSKTRNALTAFRQDNSLSVSAHYDKASVLASIEALSDAAPVAQPAERALATVETVAPKSPVLQATLAARAKAKILQWLGGGAFVATGVGSTAQTLLPNASSWREFFDVPPIVWLGIVLVASGVVWWVATQSKRDSKQAEDVKVAEYQAGGAA